MSELELRAGDADRDRVTVALRDHLVAGRLTLEEFVERVDLAQDAKTFGDLERVQRDLPDEAGQRAPAPAVRSGSHKWLVAVMSGLDRRRRWRLAARTTVITVMGGANLDLRQAELESAHSEIVIVAVMGGANVIVPEGIAVEVDGIAIMGGKNVSAESRRPLPGAPTIHIRVFAVMGGVSVRSRPGDAAQPLLDS